MQPELVTNALDTSTLLKTLIAFRDGDFSVRLPVDQTGLAGKIADTLNDIFKLNERMASEFSRISSAVGKEGKINQRATLGSASGRWAECIDSVNGLDWRPGAAVHRSRPRHRRRWPRATCRRPWRSRWTAARSRASSCTPRAW